MWLSLGCLRCVRPRVAAARPVSSDIGFPVLVCIIFEPPQSLFLFIFQGRFSCSFDVVITLCHSLRHVFQDSSSLPTRSLCESRAAMVVVNGSVTAVGVEEGAV